MKILKIISIFSFLFIQGIGQHGTLNIAIMIISLYQFIYDIFHPQHGILGEGFMMILIIGTIITYFKCKQYKEKYLFLICIFSLLLSGIFLTGVLDPNNYKQPLPIGFIVPSTVFIVTSVVLLIFYFSRTKYELMYK